MQRIITTAVAASPPDGGAVTIRPARFSLWRRLIAAMSGRVLKGQAARLAKVEHALRPGRIEQ